MLLVRIHGIIAKVMDLFALAIHWEKEINNWI
jgi:hypothetical protein